MSFVCDWCNKKLSSQQWLDKHQNELVVPCNLKCRNCDLTLSSKYLFRKHADECGVATDSTSTTDTDKTKPPPAKPKKRKRTPPSKKEVVPRNNPGNKKQVLPRNKPGYFYIVHTRRNQLLNENIFKVGKTQRSLNQRLHGYDKHSELLFSMRVHDCHYVETILKQRFGQEFEAQTEEYGVRCEYFRGDLTRMIQIAVETIIDEKQLRNEF